EDAVGDEAADKGIGSGSNESGAAALAESEQADAAWIGVRPALEIRDGSLEIGDVELGDPDEGLVTALPIAVAGAAAFGREDVEALPAKKLAIGHAGPAVGAELETEEDDAATARLTPLAPRPSQVAAAQRQAVGGGESDVFGVRNGLAARHD